jgi:hypothetical protein
VRRDADGSARVNYQGRNIGQCVLITLWEVDGGNVTEVFMICDAKSTKARRPKAPHVECNQIIASGKRIRVGKAPGVIFKKCKLSVVNEHLMKIHNPSGVVTVDESFNGQVGQAIIVEPWLRVTLKRDRPTLKRGHITIAIKWASMRCCTPMTKKK